MDAETYRRLTPKERAVLRAVSPRAKTAIIAGRLGIAEGTVETHIKSARAKLGGVSRFDAADTLRTYEATQQLGSQALEMVRLPLDEPSSPSVDPVVDCEEAEEELHEQRASFAYASQDVAVRRSVEGTRVRLGTTVRIGAMVAMIVGIALTIVAVLNMFETIDRTLPGRLVTYRTR